MKFKCSSARNRLDFLLRLLTPRQRSGLGGSRRRRRQIQPHSSDRRREREQVILCGWSHLAVHCGSSDGLIYSQQSLNTFGKKFVQVFYLQKVCDDHKQTNGKKSNMSSVTSVTKILTYFIFYTIYSTSITLNVLVSSGLSSMCKVGTFSALFLNSSDVTTATHTKLRRASCDVSVRFGCYMRRCGTFSGRSG